MERGGRKVIWKLLDPLLVRLSRRLEHLALHRPSTYREELTRARGRFASTATVTPRTIVESVASPDHIEVGDYSYIDGQISLLVAASRCRIGHHSFLAAESRLWILGTMTIGDFVLIAPGVDIFDNDSHALDALQRRDDSINVFERKLPIDYTKVAQAPVAIEDDAWIGTKSTILKGVRIGRGAVVAAGSIVTTDVAPYTLVGGNPARVLRKLS
jgi:acetyltransferase-like isoleucine patch superfamily enzyme